MMERLHPRDLRPGDPDVVLVRCPDCGQLEWWSEAELLDHSRCRSGSAPCPLCEAP